MGRIKRYKTSLVIPHHSAFFQVQIPSIVLSKDRVWIKKKEQRLAPTFVNLKSNTMKNTLQRYAVFRNQQALCAKTECL